MEKWVGFGTVKKEAGTIMDALFGDSCRTHYIVVFILLDIYLKNMKQDSCYQSGNICGKIGQEQCFVLNPF